MIRLKHCLLPLLFFWTLATPAAEAPPKPSDFAYGINLNIEAKRPLQEMLLPDSVYAGVTGASLADLRVFNAAGEVVPHALCLDARPVPERSEQHALPVFPVQEGLTPVQALGTHVEVQTQSGTHVEVTEPTQGDGGAATPRVQSYIIDVRSVPDELRAIALDWSATNGASELAVSIEASDYDELDHWQTMVERATLLRVEADGQTLQHARLALPQSFYSYLRITSLDGPVLQLRGVTAEAVVRREHLPPRWFTASPAGAGKEDNSTLYDSSHRAPLDSAKIETPDTNMSLRVSLASRDDDRDAWNVRWVGEVYAVGEGASKRVSPAVRFGASSDRMWRLQVIRGAETLGGRPLTLQLGYTPGRLRFLTQGAAPYLLAYGSGRVQGEPQDCDSLLTGFDARELASLTGAAQEAEAAHLLSGAAVLAIPEKPTPKRQIVLWAVLIAGVLLLAGMAFSLLKKLRQNP